MWQSADFCFDVTAGGVEISFCVKLLRTNLFYVLAQFLLSVPLKVVTWYT
jgi:hypothetical protein